MGCGKENGERQKTMGCGKNSGIGESKCAIRKKMGSEGKNVEEQKNGE